MAYKLIATDEMEALLDERIVYLLSQFHNDRAASHLLDRINEIYDHLEDNPYIYRESQDPFLKAFHYHEAKVTDMDYIIIYKIVGNIVYILGIFHSLENYSEKMKIIWNSDWWQIL
jgi:plasmid stabilization system protein ParE